MAVETLKLQITADNKSAVSALQQTSKSFDAMAQSSSRADAAVKKSKVNYLNLGRVIQDLPFGFQGIQNNLTQLIPSVGALGLAFSGVVAAITFAQVGLSFWTRESKAATKSTDSFTEALSKNIGEAKSEITQIEALASIASDVAKSTQERSRALKLLKEEYPGFNELQKADINDAEQLKEITNKLSAAILRKARTQAYSNLIAEEEAKQAKVTIENEKQRLNRLNGVQKAINDYVLPLMKLANGYEATATQIKINEAAMDEALDQYNASGAAIKKLKEMLADTTAEQIKFNDAQTLGGGGKGKGFTQAEIKAELLNEQLRERLKLTKSLGTGQIVTETRQSLGQRNAQPNAPGGMGRTFQVMEIERGLMGAAEAFKLYDQYVNQAMSMTNLFTSAFTDLGTALLQGQSFGEALGNVFKKLAADIAAAALKALVFRAILTGLTGGGSLAASAGTGIGGFGEIFGRFLGLRMASGGVTQGPTPALIGEAGPEAVLPLDKLGAFVDRAARVGADSMRGSSQGMNITGEFVARGQDLVLALNRAGYNLSLRR